MIFLIILSLDKSQQVYFRSTYWNYVGESNKIAFHLSCDALELKIVFSLVFACGGHVSNFPFARGDVSPGEGVSARGYGSLRGCWNTLSTCWAARLHLDIICENNKVSW